LMTVKRFYLEFDVDDKDELFKTIRERSHQILQPVAVRLPASSSWRSRAMHQESERRNIGPLPG
jgi:hypothetical protein